MLRERRGFESPIDIQERMDLKLQMSGDRPTFAQEKKGTPIQSKLSLQPDQGLPSGSSKSYLPLKVNSQWFTCRTHAFRAR